MGIGLAQGGAGGQRTTNKIDGFRNRVNRAREIIRQRQETMTSLLELKGTDRREGHSGDLEQFLGLHTDAGSCR